MAGEQMEQSSVRDGCNGLFNRDEEMKAAHASDTLARHFRKNGEKKHKLNFPNDYTEVWAEKKEKSSEFIGVHWYKRDSKWKVIRRSKIQGKPVCNGCFNRDEKMKAAHASDTLARALMKNGEKHKLNFPNDETEVWKEKNENSSKYLGVWWSKRNSKWLASRWSKSQGKMIHNGHFNQEMKAAHASDTLAKMLMKHGEKRHELNFPDAEPEALADINKKRRRKKEIEPQND